MLEQIQHETPHLHLEPGQLADYAGTEIAVTGWRVIDQSAIDLFADLVDDRQWIHCDPARAERESPFGGTIVHGFLTLSLLAGFGVRSFPTVAGSLFSVLYGFDNVRFLSPVRSGSRVRTRFVVKDVRRRASDQLLVTWRTTVEIENGSRPALVCDFMTVYFLE